MRHPAIGFLVFLTILPTIALPAAADDAKDRAIERDRKKINGTWRIVALEVNGSKTKAEDIQKLTVVNGPDGLWSLRADDQEISKGTSLFDPTQTPKTIDFAVADQAAGPSGTVSPYLGIYELGEQTRRLCFAPVGKPRPTAFASPPGSGIVLVSFQRVTSARSGPP